MKSSRRTLPDRPTYVHRQRQVTVPTPCDICHEPLPAYYVFTRCRDCLNPKAKKPYKPTGQFTASGIDGTYLSPRMRGNPDWRFTPPPPMQPAKNMLPKNRRRG